MKRFVQKFTNYLEVEKNYSQHTLRSYRTDLAELVEFLKDKAPGDVDNIDLRRFLAELKNRGCSKRTVVRKLAAVRSFFKFLFREQLVKLNPADSVFTPKLDNRLPEFLDEGKTVELVTAPSGNDITDKRDRAILEVLYSTGIRVSELVGLNDSSVDLIAGAVKVRGKGKKERIAMLGSEAQKELRSYIDKKRGFIFEASSKGRIKVDTEALFLNKRGKRLTDRSIRRLIEKYVKKCSIEQNVSPHSIRHSFATHMLNNGADLRSIQELLGHKNLSTTQIYTHLGTQKIKEIYSKAHPRA